MNFNEVNELIPYKVGEQHSNELQVYPNVWVSYPGRHQRDTTPFGGDFRVEVTAPELKWKRHAFTHSDLFRDFQVKRDENSVDASVLLDAYYTVISGTHTPEEAAKVCVGDYAGLDPLTLLQTNQCLAVAEHRRYKQHEAKFGGRFLPYRFVAGIVEGLWDAQDSANLQGRGRVGIELLEKYKGRPATTSSLMGLDTEASDALR